MRIRPFLSGTQALSRGALLAVLALTVAGCEPYGPNPSGEVNLPDATRRIHAPTERDAQLRTGTSADDLPELTGAPGADGRWPARVGSNGMTVYRDANRLVVGSEGPGARTD